jgi:hypothetical protein
LGKWSIFGRMSMIGITLLLLHIILYAPYFLPKEQSTFVVSDTVLSVNKGVPYWDNGRLICYMEI